MNYAQLDIKFNLSGLKKMTEPEGGRKELEVKENTTRTRWYISNTIMSI